MVISNCGNKAQKIPLYGGSQKVKASLVNLKSNVDSTDCGDRYKRFQPSVVGFHCVLRIVVIILWQ
jgi:hypothetical protein